MSRKKPTDRRQRHGEQPRLTVVRTGRPQLPTGRAPAPDTGWLASTRTAWATFWAEGVATLTRPADGTAVRRLFALYDARERCWRLFRKAPYVTGSMGQRVLNPMGPFSLQLDGRIEKLEAAFGIGPKARMALGITFAEAKKSLEDLAREAHDDVAEADRAAS